MKEKEYIRIRQVGKELNNKIIQSDKNSKKTLVYAAKQLNFWYEDTLVTDSEYDVDILMNFIVFEKGKNGYSQLERFYDSDVELTDFEEDILEAKMDSFSSLFQITEVDSKQNLLTFLDLLDEKKTEYLVIDLGMSKSAKEGLLLYTRLIPFKDINITSGVSFVFNQIDKNFLLKDIAAFKFKKRRKLNNTDLYILMNKKSKQYGMDSGSIEY